MSEKAFIKRLFEAYYKEKKDEIPSVSSINEREFGFMYWERPGMDRHIGFNNKIDLAGYLIGHGPMHVYSSGSLYLEPNNLDMNKKQYQGCDLIIDIDVDHFYTPCKNKHDIWYCKECGKSGKGMPNKCPNCQKTKFKTLNWICESCLDIAKNEIKKLIENFLIPDFGVKEEEIKIAFSGHRGYHLKVEEDRIRTLSSEARREIADYVAGNNLNYELLGLKEVSGTIYGFTKDNLGWSLKIINKIEELLKNMSYTMLIEKLKSYGLSENRVNSFMNYKDDFLDIINNYRNIWSIEGFGMETWKQFLKGIIHEIGIELDEPVTIDIHRLIRYPGSLHGKTGFKVQELNFEQFEEYTPLNETHAEIDPISFYSNKTQKLEITEEEVPPTKIKGENFGSFKKGEIIDVPLHIAIFLLCKEVAKLH